MTTTPDKIWLIDMDGDEFFRDYVWCDCPNPSPGMEESDATEYIRADLLQDPEWLAANGLMVVPEKVREAIKEYSEFMDGDTCHEMLFAIQDWVHPLKEANDD